MLAQLARWGWVQAPSGRDGGWAFVSPRFPGLTVRGESPTGLEVCFAAIRRVTRPRPFSPKEREMRATLITMAIEEHRRTIRSSARAGRAAEAARLREAIVELLGVLAEMGK